MGYFLPKKTVRKSFFSSSLPWRTRWSTHFSKFHFKKKTILSAFHLKKFEETLLLKLKFRKTAQRQNLEFPRPLAKSRSPDLTGWSIQMRVGINGFVQKLPNKIKNKLKNLLRQAKQKISLVFANSTIRLLCRRFLEIRTQGLERRYENTNSEKFVKIPLKKRKKTFLWIIRNKTTLFPVIWLGHYNAENELLLSRLYSNRPQLDQRQTAIPRLSRHQQLLQK